MSYELRVARDRSGIAAILLVVIIGAAALIMVKNISFLGLGGLESAYALSRGQAAMAIAEGCLEETMRRFQLDNDYAAAGYIFPLGDGACTVNTSAVAEEKTINAMGVIGDYHKRLRAVITASSTAIEIVSWEETGG